MISEKCFLLLNRTTTLELEEDVVKDYLEYCKKIDEEPHPMDFLCYINRQYSFDEFLETVDETEIEGDDEFYKLIEELKNND